jgi:hypothetical protein
MRTTTVLPAVVTTIDGDVRHQNHRRGLAEKIEPRRYQTNASLNQPPTRSGDRPVREFVTNVSSRRTVRASRRMPPAA